LVTFLYTYSHQITNHKSFYFILFYFISGGTGHIGYADPAVNHNFDDQILWAGSKKLFERFGKHPIFSCGASNVKDNLLTPCSEIKREMVKDLSGGKGVLWFNPTGSWGNLNRKVHLSRLNLLGICSEAGIPFVSGPQRYYCFRLFIFILLAIECYLFLS